jgi:hypothetical protein
MLSGAVFNGSQNDLWTNPANWDSGSTPENYMNVTLKSGKHLTIIADHPVFITNLFMEDGAHLYLDQDLTILCQTNLQTNAFLVLNKHSRFTIQNALFNNGSIYSGDGTGILSLKGTENYSLTGEGTVVIPALELNLGTKELIVTFNSSVSVIGHIELKTGVINARGNLTMRSTSLQSSAAIFPVSDISSAGIIGNVNVERYIEGNLPSPSTGRGWRLLSSPVFHSAVPAFSYDVLSLKNSAFITGTGGVTNGFDASPNNGGTVYTHDQSLRGTLAQKYVAFKNINMKVLMGRGIFLFSRGNRTLPDAFTDQITSFPFKNPEPYVLTSTGSLFFGDLTIPLFNSNYGEDGDGFNLVGNPYASGIVWGELIKENLGPFVWMFNPPNNDYIVTDDANAVINSGTGFFVKVLKENTEGSITFKEETKVKAAAAKALQMAIMSNQRVVLNTGRLTARISRDVFFQDYTIQFLEHGNVGVDNDDALSIGNGYVGLSSLIGKIRLAIEKRPPATEETVIKLSIAGWSAGQYNLSFKGMKSFGDNVKAFLLDTYLNLIQEIKSEASTYLFMIDPQIQSSQGDERFSLIFKKSEPIAQLKPEIIKDIGPSVYPNPFKDIIHLKTNSFSGISTSVIIRDFSGKAVFKKMLGTLQAESVTDLSLTNLLPGFYFLEMKAEGQRKFYKSLKIIKL